MKPEFEQKLLKVIADAKEFMAQWQPLEVVFNSPTNTVTQVYDEMAKNTNLVNLLGYHRKNLHFILTLLLEGKAGISANTPSGSQLLKQFTKYEEIVREILRGYKALDEDAYWVLRYYDRGGGLQYDRANQ